MSEHQIKQMILEKHLSRESDFMDEIKDHMIKIDKDFSS